MTKKALKKILKKPRGHIVPLYMNGMLGRMLRMEPPKGKSREILLVYGLQSSLDQILPLAQELNQYGGVTVPDLPGLGGMQSFYRIGEKPTLDNLAGYLASFIKLRYKHRRLTIFSVGYGFAVTTRLLQKYPELAKKVDLLVSSSGFVHHDDFVKKRPKYIIKRLGTSLFSRRLPAWIAQTIFMRPRLLRAAYSITAISGQRLKRSNSAQVNKRLDQAIELRRMNDLRTYMTATQSTLTLDLCKLQVNLPLYHLSLNIRRFDEDVLEQHLNVVYKKVLILPTRATTRAKILTSNFTLLPNLPVELREQLSK